MDKIKKATSLLDIILDGKYNQFKTIVDGVKLLDKHLNEIQNNIDHVPDQDLDELVKDVENEIGEEEATIEESIKKSMKKLVVNEDYKTVFKGMMKKWNIKSISQLDNQKKKAFFSAVDKAWKSEKEK